MTDYAALKNRHRAVRETFPPNLNVRIHRALSWAQRAEDTHDDDGRFIFYWIAFNAAYALELDDRANLSEHATFQDFLQKLCRLDTEQQLDAIVWKEFSGSIRILLDNPYVFKEFWDYHAQRIGSEQWEERFERGKSNAKRALQSGNTYFLLREIFSRMYVLRNQLLHGGATWNSRVNRAQVRDSANLLAKIMPIFITLMLDNPQIPWPNPNFPVIQR